MSDAKAGVAGLPGVTGMAAEAALPLPSAITPPAPPGYPQRVQEIVHAARDLLETEGADALTMRRIGDVVGIRAASLYKHLPGKTAVRTALVEAAFREVGEALHQAVDLGGERDGERGGVAALLATYRHYAREHPNLYRLVTNGPLDRDGLTAGLEDWAGEPFFRATGDPFVAQALWAAAHGTVILELDDRYLPGSDLDATWRALAAAFGPRGSAARR
jgi:AcrR family transcriptional regulator